MSRRDAMQQARHEAAHAERERIAELLEVAAADHVRTRGDNVLTRMVADVLREQATRVRVTGRAVAAAPRPAP